MSYQPPDTVSLGLYFWHFQDQISKGQTPFIDLGAWGYKDLEDLTDWLIEHPRSEALEELSQEAGLLEFCSRGLEALGIEYKHPLEWGIEGGKR